MLVVSSFFAHSLSESSAMDLLSISPSHHLSTSLPSRRLSYSLSKPNHSSFNPQISIPSRSQSSRASSVRCLLASQQNFSENLIFRSKSKQPNPSFELSAPQTPATAMRGAETDAMGLLLRERIVFLGNSIDDFVADAIISQLLLLDAQDSTKDIRLFINSPGGSLRSDFTSFLVYCLVADR